jgi:selenocysteine lyase/cysteine desulfurase
MPLTRRELLQTIGGTAVAAGFERSLSAWPAEGTGFERVRAEFPRAARKLWLAAAETHPFHVSVVEALERYAQYRSLGPGEGRQTLTPEDQDEAKRLYGALIGARPQELAFITGTTDGENIVVAGMDLARQGGNVVIDDLHFDASKHLYNMLAKDGRIELRVVHHRDWRVRLEDMDRAIDRNTRLVSMALVSNVNGYLEDAKAISGIAHTRGAHVFADIIQGAGAIPLDMRALGIDFASGGTYKWVMGDFGFGFLYVREELQGTLVKPTRHGLRQVAGGAPRPGAAQYEGMSTLPTLPAICALHGLRVVARLGVPDIRRHAKALTDRLQKEMPKLGYASLTPPDNPTPIVSFQTPDPKVVAAKLDKAFGEHVVTARAWDRMGPDGRIQKVSGLRIGVSVYNDQSDLDQFFNALS